ncbi:uncharacterized protein F4822DRAFT_398702 [Hypoxylon trugodes]|uniref:uncharacterized protein n=1 Tax=Hypoxylon trugodes TaxID=326681 RepID=UPI00218E3AE2|nr:uncharacterized protein F4822DRAFT_398702 [Hypoxylon trugodes]KAI1389521.1 hypothetical protein F4822DRAFT_398702 [Hypoxylon trugodes]
MANNGISQGSSHILGAASTFQHSKVPPQEDESEWEYEYSNTETETFYVTLDLSKADFTSRETGSAYRGNEKYERAKLYLNRRTSPGHENEDGAGNSDEDDNISRNQELKEPQQEEDIDQGDDHQVQILELHSENPVISYKGRVYSGQWSQNVGTELLMTKHDDENPLPVVRRLDQDVDILAASCSRITVKEKQLNPKDDASNRQRGVNGSDGLSYPQPVVPPAERWSSRERIDQGNFLANFIALKKRRGETDEVTVIARGVDPRPHRNRSRKEKMKHGHRGKFNLPHTRGPRRAKRSDILSTLLIREHEEVPGEEGEGGVSTPTPQRWDDLAGGGEEIGGEDGEDEEQDKVGNSKSNEEEDEVDGMDVDGP